MTESPKTISEAVERSRIIEEERKEKRKEVAAKFDEISSKYDVASYLYRALKESTRSLDEMLKIAEEDLADDLADEEHLDHIDTKNRITRTKLKIEVLKEAKKRGSLDKYSKELLEEQTKEYQTVLKPFDDETDAIIKKMYEKFKGGPVNDFNEELNAIPVNDRNVDTISKIFKSLVTKYELEKGTNDRKELATVVNTELSKIKTATANESTKTESRETTTPAYINEFNQKINEIPVTERNKENIKKVYTDIAKKHKLKKGTAERKTLSSLVKEEINKLSLSETKKQETTNTKVETKKQVKIPTIEKLQDEIRSKTKKYGINKEGVRKAFSEVIKKYDIKKDSSVWKELVDFGSSAVNKVEESKKTKAKPTSAKKQDKEKTIAPIVENESTEAKREPAETTSKKTPAQETNIKDASEYYKQSVIDSFEKKEPYKSSTLKILVDTIKKFDIKLGSAEAETLKDFITKTVDKGGAHFKNSKITISTAKKENIKTKKKTKTPTAEKLQYEMINEVKKYGIDKKGVLKAFIDTLIKYGITDLDLVGKLVSLNSFIIIENIEKAEKDKLRDAKVNLPKNEMEKYKKAVKKFSRNRVKSRESVDRDFLGTDKEIYETLVYKTDIKTRHKMVSDFIKSKAKYFDKEGIKSVKEALMSIAKSVDESSALLDKRYYKKSKLAFDQVLGPLKVLKDYGIIPRVFGSGYDPKNRLAAINVIITSIELGSDSENYGSAVQNIYQMKDKKLRDELIKEINRIENEKEKERESILNPSKEEVSNEVKKVVNDMIMASLDETIDDGSESIDTDTTSLDETLDDETDTVDSEEDSILIDSDKTREEIINTAKEIVKYTFKYRGRDNKKTVIGNIFKRFNKQSEGMGESTIILVNRAIIEGVSEATSDYSNKPIDYELTPDNVINAIEPQGAAQHDVYEEYILSALDTIPKRGIARLLGSYDAIEEVPENEETIGIVTSMISKIENKVKENKDFLETMREVRNRSFESNSPYFRDVLGNMEKLRSLKNPKKEFNNIIKEIREENNIIEDSSLDKWLNSLTELFEGTYTKDTKKAKVIMIEDSFEPSSVMYSYKKDIFNKEGKKVGVEVVTDNKKPKEGTPYNIITTDLKDTVKVKENTIFNNSGFYNIPDVIEGFGGAYIEVAEKLDDFHDSLTNILRSGSTLNRFLGKDGTYKDSKYSDAGLSAVTPLLYDKSGKIKKNVSDALYASISDFMVQYSGDLKKYKKTDADIAGFLGIDESLVTQEMREELEYKGISLKAAAESIGRNTMRRLGMARKEGSKADEHQYNAIETGLGLSGLSVLMDNGIIDYDRSLSIGTIQDLIKGCEEKYR